MLLQAWITPADHPPTIGDVSALQNIFDWKLTISVMNDGRTAIYAEKIRTAVLLWFYMTHFAPHVKPTLLHSTQI